MIWKVWGSSLRSQALGLFKDRKRLRCFITRVRSLSKTNIDARPDDGDRCHHHGKKKCLGWSTSALLMTLRGSPYLNQGTMYLAKVCRVPSSTLSGYRGIHCWRLTFLLQPVAEPLISFSFCAEASFMACSHRPSYSFPGLTRVELVFASL